MHFCCCRAIHPEDGGLCVIDEDIPAVLEAPDPTRLSLFVHKDWTPDKAETYNGQEYLYMGGYRCGTTMGIDGGSRKLCHAKYVETQDWGDWWDKYDMCENEFEDISNDWELVFYHTDQSSPFV